MVLLKLMYNVVSVQFHKIKLAKLHQVQDSVQNQIKGLQMKLDELRTDPLLDGADPGQELVEETPGKV